VHKAIWKGTEVAVKVIASEKITKDMEKSFQDEVFDALLLMLTNQHWDTNVWRVAGASDDVAASPERGAVHGGVDQGAQDVHRHGVHVSRLAL
jgi:hypothetical protein